MTAGIVLNFTHYFPADFTAEFLIGRELYFSGSYQWAFYSHILSGPTTLVLGLVLLSQRFRARFRQWHHWLGRVQIGLVLCVVFPSGLWMAFYADTGFVAGLGFGTLAVGTARCAWNGWRQAVRKRFVEHRCWMSRCYVLLCSAVVLRLMAGVLTVIKVEDEWTYSVTAWASWLIPLVFFELIDRRRRFANGRKS